MDFGSFVQGLLRTPWLPWALGGLVGLLSLLIVVDRRRSGPSRSRRQRDEAKVAPRRGRSARRRAGTGPSRTDEMREGEAVMTTARTTNYVQALKALLGRSSGDASLEPARRLFHLARTLHAHRAGSLQDLRAFRDAQELLHFDVEVRPIANSNGVALRFTHDGALLAEAPGPYRGEQARRFAEHAQGLQQELRAWIDSLHVLLQASAAGGRPEAASTSPRSAPADDAPRRPPASGHAAVIDLEGLRTGQKPAGDTDVRVSDLGLPRSPSQGQAFPSAPRADERVDRDPIRDAFGARSRRTAEDSSSRLDDPMIQQRIPSEPDPGATPPLEHLPSRIARTVEEIEELRDDLQRGPADASPRVVQEHLTKATLEKSSLLDRLDHFVFSSFDRPSLPPEARDDDGVRRALAWIERQQEHLADQLLRDFGLKTYTPQIGEIFEPTRHIATDTQPTREQRLDRSIASVVSHGYEIDGALSVLQRPKVLVYVFEGAPPGDPNSSSDDSASPSSSSSSPLDDAALEVPVDYTYAGTQDFSITVQALWKVRGDVHAWIEVDGRRLEFAVAEVSEPSGSETRVHLGGCNVPKDVRDGEGFLVVRESGEGRTARHPFEVIT